MIDVVVVGAGPTGCLVADRLCERGLHVELLEAGPLDKRSNTLEASAYQARGAPYDWIRVRGVGGRSLVWGGWCQRFSDEGFRRAGWPISGRTMAEAYRVVERRLGVVTGPLDDRFRQLSRALGVPVLPKRAPLVAGGIWTARRSRSSARARTGMLAIALEHGAGRGREIVALDLARKKRVSFAARAFVLAPSAIETACILLRSGIEPRVGRRLVDHVVLGAVLWEEADVPRASHPLAGHALVPNVVNEGPGSRRPYRGGFSVEILGPMRASGMRELGVEPPTGARSATLIHTIGEIFPDPRRFVELGATADREARPRIHWVVTAEDRKLLRDMERGCTRVADQLATTHSQLTVLSPMSGGHEAGTCPIGPTKHALVDAHGRLGAMPNVWIADASIMPTAGDRHPTLTLLAHGERLSRALARELA